MPGWLARASAKPLWRLMAGELLLRPVISIHRSFPFQLCRGIFSGHQTGFVIVHADEDVAQIAVYLSVYDDDGDVGLSGSLNGGCHAMHLVGRDNEQVHAFGDETVDVKALLPTVATRAADVEVDGAHKRCFALHLGVHFFVPFVAKTLRHADFVSLRLAAAGRQQT